VISKQEIREHFAKFGKKGGRARAQNMSAEDRSAAARKAVQARWAETPPEERSAIAKKAVQARIAKRKKAKASK
jgi:hypothetical protein